MYISIHIYTCIRIRIDVYKKTKSYIYTVFVSVPVIIACLSPSTKLYKEEVRSVTTRGGHGTGRGTKERKQGHKPSQLHQRLQNYSSTATNAPSPLSVATNYDFVNINGINVTDYTEYVAKDIEALAAYAAVYDDKDNAVLETTLGLVSVAAGMETPFFYVTGFVDRVGHFSEDVPNPPYAQNSIGSHNIGVVLANIIDRLETYYANVNARSSAPSENDLAG